MGITPHGIAVSTLRTALPLSAAEVPVELFYKYAPVPFGDACAEWLGPRNRQGYGELNGGPRRLRAHRAAFALAHGSVPAGLVIDHLCRNRACIRVDHLEVTTPRMNTQRGTSPLAAAVESTSSGVCVNGHRLSEVGLHRSGDRFTCAQCGRDRVAAYKRRLRDAA